uniref:Oxysterol-binding protein n=1 Tax=Setaria digitata TaxID=48799 RepID=A0A915Q0V3_9BILA
MKLSPSNEKLPETPLSSPNEVEKERAANIGSVLKSGYLTKKIWRFGRSTSYFVLRDNGKFYFYKNEAIAEDPRKFRGFTNIKDVYIVPRGLKGFVIYTKKSVWYLKTRTVKDRDDWIEKLKSARATLRMKDEEELKRILNASPNREEKLDPSKIITDLDDSLQITYKNLRMLELKLNDFRHSLPDGEQLNKAQIADLDDTAHKVIANIQSALEVVGRYFVQSKSLKKEIKRMAHDINYESQQRSNLLRQVELQAKQLNCIEKEVQTEFGFWQDCDLSETAKSEISEREPKTASTREKTAIATTPSFLRKSEGKLKRSFKPIIASPVILLKPEVTDVSQNLKQISRKRRSQIPYRKKSAISLWSLLKNAMGKELYKIPLPVNFNEPISFIQRMTECLEYSDLLDKAAKIVEPGAQMIYVSAFLISTLCNTPFRTCKPFNPLWCETFEFDRTADLGWRVIGEQVSHHPPISAIHAEGNGWILDEDMDVHSQFQATVMKIFAEGTASIFFPQTKSFYYWTMKDIKTLVKGFIVGPITVHNEGSCVIMNQPDGITCVFTLARHRFFSSDNERTFSGKICDKSGKELYCLTGDWTQKCVIAKGNDKFKEGQVIWTRNIQPKESELMYNYSALAIELNEPEVRKYEMKKWVGEAGRKLRLNYYWPEKEK